MFCFVSVFNGTSTFMKTDIYIYIYIYIYIDWLIETDSDRWKD